MGRAKIISEQGEGRYTIEIDYGSAERTRRLERVDMRLYELTLRKTWQSDLLADIEAGLPSLLSEMNALILAYVAATKAVPRDPQNEAAIKKQIDDKTVQLNKQRTLIQSARNDLSLTELQYKSAELERGTLEQLNLVVEQGAWCADYTEDAAGTVATLEINGESGLTLIAPSAPVPAADDGVMVAREMQSPEQVFWNAAVLPGWQKWKPTYRTGTITALDYEADTASVTLDAATSSALDLEIDKRKNLKDVPVKYMDCNAGAFEEDDHVVVMFEGQNQAAPQVIGFVENPRACNWPCVLASPYYYRYLFENKLADSDPSFMSGLMSTSISVSVRVDSGPWIAMEYLTTISASGGLLYNEWRQPGGNAVLMVGYNFYLSRFNDSSAPKVDGVSVHPGAPVGIPPGIPDPTIHEFKIVSAGRIRFNAAIYSDPGVNVTPKSGQAKAPGGIKLAGDSMPVTVLDYALNQPEEA